MDTTGEPQRREREGRHRSVRGREEEVEDGESGTRGEDGRFGAAGWDRIDGIGCARTGTERGWRRMQGQRIGGGDGCRVRESEIETDTGQRIGDGTEWAGRRSGRGQGCGVGRARVTGRRCGPRPDRASKVAMHGGAGDERRIWGPDWTVRSWFGVDQQCATQLRCHATSFPSPSPTGAGGTGRVRLPSLGLRCLLTLGLQRLGGTGRLDGFPWLRCLGRGCGALRCHLRAGAGFGLFVGVA